ncbi:ZYRO0G17710p [Zygosaccharomyces rouxii]|uniref:ZYRO0G17710p n=1 Tax=Zygosaccharomyces rouxii (strain ATCC 2623 / CBS 732 / NBRC 1130 / NCYC 568 / NRRL Y-229) TaxID=559307 RepID=C5E134_ZYGRC|nr:mitochondrial 37S ribosomal protein RSM26 [Zygosaccharomyces rouxii]KAH9202811.1 mitochondrial 37S ribosomal protein RSM26 [Zygosaccharomyces rouxii]CAR29818.1 ZYRO0G17710p [Zygosaccharomyces rouxii]
MIGSTLCRRGIHTVPKLPNAWLLQQQGIPNVLSAKGFQTLWNQHQKYLCDKLTLATSGTSMESYFPFHLLLNTAKRPFQTHIFNLASAAHNNHLFVENILPTTHAGNTQPSRSFLTRIEESFENDWESVKEEMVRRADQEVLGQGWLFLVENANKELHILLTQNNGTPYYFPRNQLFDLNSALTLEEFAQLQEVRKLVKSREGQKVEDWTMPLICVSLWDQAYLHDYGVKNRSQYVKNVLDNLNWSVVNSRLYSSAQ